MQFNTYEQNYIHVWIEQLFLYEAKIAGEKQSTF